MRHTHRYDYKKPIGNTPFKETWRRMNRMGRNNCRASKGWRRHVRRAKAA